MRARIGKIARLPKEIREAVNWALEQGRPGQEVVRWLNSLEAVQRVLSDQFQGVPISEQNLSQWRDGGFQDWLEKQEKREQLQWFIQEHPELDVDENFIGKSLRQLMVVELGGAMRELQELENPAERWDRFRQISREFSRLRTGHFREQQHELSWQRWTWRHGGAKIHPDKTDLDASCARKTDEKRPGIKANHTWSQ